MKRSEYRLKYGSVKKQALKQGVVNPVRATIHTFSKMKALHEDANHTLPLKDRSSIYSPPSDVGVSDAGSCSNEPMPTPPVGSSMNYLSLEENLPSAPALTINPICIAAIPEEPLLEKLEDEDLQNAVVHQNSKLFKNTEGQYVIALLSERTK